MTQDKEVEERKRVIDEVVAMATDIENAAIALVGHGLAKSFSEGRRIATLSRAGTDPVTKELVRALEGFLTIVDTHFTKEFRDKVPGWYEACKAADAAIMKAIKPR